MVVLSALKLDLPMPVRIIRGKMTAEKKGLISVRFTDDKGNEMRIMFPMVFATSLTDVAIVVKDVVAKTISITERYKPTGASVTGISSSLDKIPPQKAAYTNFFATIPIPTVTAPSIPSPAELAKIIFTSPQSSIANLGALTDYEEEMIKALDELGNTAEGNVKYALSEVYAGKPIRQYFASEIAEAMGRAAKYVMRGCSVIIRGKINVVFWNVYRFISGMVNNIITTIGNVKTTITSTITNVKTAIDTTAKNANTAIDKVRSNAEGTISSLKNGADIAIAGLIGNIALLGGEDFTKIVKGTNTAFSDYNKSVGTAMWNNMNSVEMQLTDVSKDVADKVNTMSKDIITGIKNAMGGKLQLPVAITEITEGGFKFVAPVDNFSIDYMVFGLAK